MIVVLPTMLIYCWLSPWGLPLVTGLDLPGLLCSPVAASGLPLLTSQSKPTPNPHCLSESRVVSFGAITNLLADLTSQAKPKCAVHFALWKLPHTLCGPTVRIHSSYLIFIFLLVIVSVLTSCLQKEVAQLSLGSPAPFLFHREGAWKSWTCSF